MIEILTGYQLEGTLKVIYLFIKKTVLTIFIVHYML